MIRDKTPGDKYTGDWQETRGRTSQNGKQGKTVGQSGRYELKYILDEERAVAVANYIRAYLRPSEHNAAGPVRGHPVVSLYMDSPDYFFFRQAFTGLKNRMKLRIRFYDDHWERPAFFEIKRRVSDVICKDRAMISREGVRQFLTGGWPCPNHWPDPTVLKHGKRRIDVYYKFWNLCSQIKAEGTIYISYLREIYEAANDDEHPRDLRPPAQRHAVRRQWKTVLANVGIPASARLPSLLFPFQRRGLGTEIR